MGQPNPPGDMPLYDGLSSEWNEFVGAFPEAQRAELAPRLAERVKGYEEKLKPWEEFHKNGVTPDYASTALNIYGMIENRPREVLDAMAKHLGLTVSEVKEAVETMQEEVDDDDPRLSTLQQQVEVLTKIALAQREQTSQQETVKQAEIEIEKEFNDLRKEFGDDINEDEIIMRMVQKGMSAKEAHLEFSNLASELRKRPPAPRLIGSGGAVPQRAIDPTKLTRADTKGLVTQMMRAAQAETKR